LRAILNPLKTGSGEKSTRYIRVIYGDWVAADHITKASSMEGSKIVTVKNSKAKKQNPASLPGSELG
jgi:hypothetical protein